MGGLAPLYYILSFIYIRNPLSFNFSPKSRSINNILIFIILKLFNFAIKPAWLVLILSTISQSLSIITIYKSHSLFLILMSFSNLEVNAPSVIIGAILGRILFNFINTITR